VARALDESSRIAAWAKNVRLGFAIPYQHQGIAHEFIPDFICRLRDADGLPSDEYLIFEVKGLERESYRSKDVGASRWLDAVNYWGKLGRWRYAKLHSPYELKSVLGVASGQ
jgi:type III restriction enzyme